MPTIEKMMEWAMHGVTIGGAAITVFRFFIFKILNGRYETRTQATESRKAIADGAMKDIAVLESKLSTALSAHSESVAMRFAYTDGKVEAVHGAVVRVEVLLMRGGEK